MDVMDTWDAGLRTTEFPAAKAGATLWATRLRGKLKGLMAPITPRGKCLTNPHLSVVCALRSRGMISPPILFASSEAILKVLTVLSTSIREDLMVFPEERAMDLASSSFLLSIPEEIFSSAWERSKLESFFVSANASSAAATASSIWCELAK